MDLEGGVHFNPVVTIYFQTQFARWSRVTFNPGAKANLRTSLMTAVAFGRSGSKGGSVI